MTDDTAPRDQFIADMVEQMLDNPRLIGELSRAVATAAEIHLARLELGAMDDGIES